MTKPIFDANGCLINGFIDRFGKFVSKAEYAKEQAELRKWAQGYIQTERGKELNQSYFKNLENIKNGQQQSETLLEDSGSAENDRLREEER